MYEYLLLSRYELAKIKVFSQLRSTCSEGHLEAIQTSHGRRFVSIIRLCHGLVWTVGTPPVYGRPAGEMKEARLGSRSRWYCNPLIHLAARPVLITWREGTGGTR